jgi:hypothetical protein
MMGYVEIHCTYLILSVERDDTSLMCSDDCLAGLDNLGRGLKLQLIRNEKQEERALEEVDAEEEGHELQTRVVFENAVDGFGGADGVVGCRDEALAGDPKIIVIQQIDGIPLPGEQDVKHVHDVSAVGHDNLGLNVRLGHAVRSVGVDRMDGRGSNVAGVVLGGVLWRGVLLIAHHGSLAVGPPQVQLLESPQALFVRLEMPRDLGSLVIPFLGRSEAETEPRVVPRVV